MTSFKLTIAEGQRITPGEGEELGRNLHAAALAMVAGLPLDTSQANRQWISRQAAVLYHLSADAFERGASASLGHNRADRYREAAAVSREMAVACEAG